MPDPSPQPPWVTSKSAQAMHILEHARQTRRPVVLLLGAGVSVDAGIPLASQLKEYLIQFHRLVRDEGFTNARQYVEELRWPSRHDLRVDLMLKETDRSLITVMPKAERLATQAAMLSEMRRDAPILAASLQEIFGQLDPKVYNAADLKELYGAVVGLAETLGRRSPRNIAYRSLLFHLCDRNQTTIDACLDHFMRDRAPATPHQFLYFLTQSLNCRVILTTNFDQLLETAFAGEGLLPRVYEVHGEGSIPSGQLLLSQHLSIVKLHGGAHQLQTGFDLDDPLSPAALSTFADLFRQLQPAGGDPPLIVALGYSGSDRRVMDIVTNHIRGWRMVEEGRPYRPRVLWVNRDAWLPELLDSAVRTHPEVLQHGDTATRADQFPAHVVRYREGRMFLFEAIQRLRGHFPIARSHYQAVNFVQHTTEGDGSGGPVPDGLKDGDHWRLALIHAPKSGGGSSSALVALADHLEMRHETRTIWIDLTEVVGVAALMDVLSERLVKLDSRLQPIRRPLVLQYLRDPITPNTLAQQRSRRHELRTAAQWLRHALRRGRYLIALDSLDEFPCRHPALPEKPNERFEEDQRALFFDLLRELLLDPSLIGDSRIALALSDEGTANSPFRSLITAFHVDQKGLRDIRYHVHTGGKPSAEPPRSVRDQFSAFFHLPDDPDPPPNPGLPPNVPYSPERYHSALAGLVVLVSVCARRIRSEVMLTRCVSELLGRLLRSKLLEQAGGFDCDSQEVDELRKWVFAVLVGGDFMDRIRRALKRPAEAVIGYDIWEEYSQGSQHKIDLGFPQLDQDILGSIRTLVGYTSPANTLPQPDRDRQWIYRTEGGYHWMHRDVRDELYNKLRFWGKPDDAQVPADDMDRVLAATHHTVALFSYDELYERSRDARSFLEYMFHRIAAIRLAAERVAEAGRLKCVCGWVHRLVLALHREKHALLTRVRLPGLIRMITQLADEISSERINEAFVPPPAEESDEARYLTKVVEYRDDLYSLLSEFFLASGHPHSAFESLCRRSWPEKLAEADANSGQVQWYRLVSQYLTRVHAERNEGDIAGLIKDNGRVLRDLAAASQDPILSRIEFPKLGQSRDPRSKDGVRASSVGSQPEIPDHDLLHDWLNGYVESDGNRLNSKTSERDTRLTIARQVYELFIKAEKQFPRSLRLDRNWSESNADDDLVMGMIRRMLEFRLTQYPTAWVGSAEVYWDRGSFVDGSDATAYRGKLGKFRDDQKSYPEPLNPATDLMLYDKAELLGGSVPILRSSDRRRRNECHRLCLVARLKVAEKFSVRQTATDLLQLAEAWWPRIRRSLEAAEAILSRIGDPADRQAMAITRLTFAELLLRRAETHQLASDTAPAAAKELAELAARWTTVAVAVKAATEAVLNKRAHVADEAQKVFIASLEARSAVDMAMGQEVIAKADSADLFAKAAIAAIIEAGRAGTDAAVKAQEADTARAQVVTVAEQAARASKKAARVVGTASNARVKEDGSKVLAATKAAALATQAAQRADEAAKTAAKIAAVASEAAIVAAGAVTEAATMAKDLAATDAANLRSMAKNDHAEAGTLLSTVEALLNEGRGENRWRFFYLLTRSRWHMFKALTLRDDSRRQGLLDLQWAARHLVGATSNCGLWTDRYDVLGWWWDTWQSFAKGFFPNQPHQFDQYLREMKARLGIRWFHENYARRDDRWQSF